jgi:ATP-dependent helicase HrpB
MTDRVADEVQAVLARPRDETGDVLVFLPGAGEIRRVQEQVRAGGDLILPLYGSLPFEQQVKALQPAPARKVILATNIAETSLTIPGVRTVIDSGLARQATYDAQRGLDSLNLGRISKASATQRAGRAGRVAPGHCIRLWTAKEQNELDDFDAPDIHRVDLSTTILSLHAWGKNDVRAFGWFDAPPETSVAAAERLLWMLGGLSAETGGRITPLGKLMLNLPVHPRLARLLIAAADKGLLSEGAAIAALLSDRDTSFQGQARQMHGQSDLLILLERQLDWTTARLKEDLERMMRRSGTPPRRVADETELLKLILLAYPDRVCRRRGSDPERGVMVGGGGVRVARESAVRTAEFFVAVDVRRDDRSARSEALVRVASAIEPEWLAECFPDSVTRETSVQYDSDRGRVIGAVQMRYLDLVLSESGDATVDARRAGEALAAALRPRAAEIFAADESCAGVMARLEFLRKWMPEHPWPQFDAEMLGEALAEACEGKRGIEELKRQSLCDFLMRRLAYPLDRLLEHHAPREMGIPSGKSIRLRYEPGRAPVLAARLQELFGLKQTPRVAGGRVAVVMEILGPNYRPVQVTDDLASFWATTYFQVKKDLKRRYPKHAWPDDPLTAIPRSRGR